MQPGTRVRLIQESARALGAMSWDDMDLTLRAFGIETPYSEQGQYAYALDRLESLTDDVLVEVHTHLNPTSAERERQDEGATGPWDADKFRLFCSHTHHHAKEVGILKQQLAEDSIEAFVAHTDIRPTNAWLRVVESALETCDALAAFLTHEFRGSEWTDQEVGWALGRGVLILAVKVDESPHGFIGQWQALPGRVDGLANSIYEALRDNPQTRRRMAEVLVARFARTSSWDDARANMRRLEAIPMEAWTDELLEEAKRAAQETHDLRTGFYGYGTVPDAVESLANRVRVARAEAAG